MPRLSRSRRVTVSGRDRSTDPFPANNRVDTHEDVAISRGLMTHEPEAPSESSAHENGRALLVLCALAIVAGVLVGLVGGTFRYLLI